MRGWQCVECVPALPPALWAPGPLKELDAGSMVDLLGELHARLLARSAPAGIYLVGGAALLLGYGRTIATPDVDVARAVAVADEVARELARERGLAMNWLNAAAGGWVPPRPACARVDPDRPGLMAHLAPARHLLAMKLVAWRPKDEDDLASLLEVCGLADASADQVADVLYEVYSAEDSLAGMLNVPRADELGTRQEAVARARDALRLL